MDNNAKARWNVWCNLDYEDEDLKKEILEIYPSAEKIEELFGSELQFGTGGLRGIMGVGTNRINIYTVGKVTQGYSNFLKNRYESPHIVIAYDSRKKSGLFAQRAARILAANGIYVYLFQHPTPTPVLSFTIRRLKCQGGIVITASHNPAQYNGYKIYAEDGGQAVPELAEQIKGFINQVNIFKDVKEISLEAAGKNHLISYVQDEIRSCYIKTVLDESLNLQQGIKHLKIVYTPLNGTGIFYIPEVLRCGGFSNIKLVNEQLVLDGKFDTCKTPNPELETALSLGLQYAKTFGADILLATDPDCDRISAAVKTSDGYEMLSGNQMGILLLDYICQRRVETGTMPYKPIAVKSIVTTDLAEKIIRSYKGEMINVLTGFKYVGDVIRRLEERNEENRFVFGLEESCGYLSGTSVRDKDAVSTSLLICQMAEYYLSHGLDLKMALTSLYMKYGYIEEFSFSYEFKDAGQNVNIQSMMDQLRKSYIENLLGYQVVQFHDYKNSCIYFKNDKCKSIQIPAADMIKILLEDGTSITIRPSGTEPKLKIYVYLQLNPVEKSAKEFDKKRKRIKEGLDKLFCIQFK